MVSLQTELKILLESRKIIFLLVSYVLRRSSRRRANNEPIDISTEAQIRDIEASFEFANDKFDLSKIKHPAKSHVTAVESYEILPDVEIWANAYDLFRFQERPGERPLDVPDPRLDCAILRPMESDGDHFLAYYLAKEDEIAENFKEKRRQDEEVEETIFSFVRDYETVKIEQEVPNEFLLVLDDGEEDDSPFGDTPNRRGKGAYYKNLERKIMLKKRRVNVRTIYIVICIQDLLTTHSSLAMGHLCGQMGRDQPYARTFQPR